MKKLQIHVVVYNISPEMWLKKCCPAISFINTNLPEKRIRMSISKEKIELMPKNSTDIFKKSKINIYMDRSTSGIIAWLKNITYYILTKKLCVTMITSQILLKKRWNKIMIVKPHVH